MKSFANKVCVVTGAGSGIGRALALSLKERGARLALSDINPDELNTTAKELDLPEEALFVKPFDVADQEAVFAFKDEVIEHFGAVHLVINNAGVALGSGPLWDTSIDDFKWLMDINFYGVLYGTKAFLPLMREQDEGHIVNISSLFGLIGVPEQTAYNSSKFAVRGLTEALRHELKREKSGVSCTSVHPGGVKTNIARSARVVSSTLTEEEKKQQREEAIAHFDTLARTTTASAADQILKAVTRDKMRVLVGFDAKLMDAIQRLMPSGYAGILAKLSE